MTLAYTTATETMSFDPMIQVCPWGECLPRPATHSYETPLQPLHVGILMRCAEEYDITDYHPDG
jgi:hypothetical protein